MEEEKKAYSYCIYLLARRDYSVYKMHNKLKEKKYSPEVSEQVINKLLEQNYIREEEYKRQRIKQHILRGYANKFIIQKLEQEKLSCETEEIESIRSAQDLGSQSIIESLIEKKLRFKEIPSEWEPKQNLKNKVLRFLLSKGYQYSEVKNSVNARF